ncbi:MAG: M23 family metallopeptidase [Leptospiraceae bacterium]|nr:M23 family metallopeptidase [Leptospiraceae bacterium]MCK6381682.1 M23 family metallopeptidase [Leptospiraceae bacterium]NUM40555.1 M23 family metallopeptidase [Leptospiraceae bacterium]
MFKKFKKNLGQTNPYIKQKIDSVKEKGHERMTIFIIPHGYDKSFNFQISLFSIVFIFFLITSLIGISIYGIFKSSYVKTQLNSLSNDYGQFFDEYIVLTSDIGKIQKDYSKINDDLQDLYNLIDGSEEELLKILPESEIQDHVFSDLKKEELADKELVPGRSYLSEIYDFRKLKMIMLKNQPLLDASNEFLETRANIQHNMPLVTPLANYTITSIFGFRRSPTMGYFENHDGIDMAIATGTPIYATAPGRVARVSYSDTGYGYHIIISHENGFQTLYAHCSRIFVSNGQYVNRGATIGLVGATGNVTGPHLHYEVWIGGSSVKTNPDEFLNAGLY